MCWKFQTGRRFSRPQTEVSASSHFYDITVIFERVFRIRANNKSLKQGEQQVHLLNGDLSDLDEDEEDSEEVLELRKEVTELREEVDFLREKLAGLLQNHGWLRFNQTYTATFT